MTQPKDARCELCGAPIVWARIKDSRRSMPVDAKPVANGPVVLVRDRDTGERVAWYDQGDGRNTHTNHYSTCTSAKHFFNYTGED